MRFDVLNSVWQRLGNVQAAGNSAVVNKYSFRCVAATGMNQLRLKQIDIDGKYFYSPILSINFDDLAANILYSRSTRTL